MLDLRTQELSLQREGDLLWELEDLCGLVSQSGEACAMCNKKQIMYSAQFVLKVLHSLRIFVPGSC